MSFFDDRTDVRIQKNQIREIERIIFLNKDKYNSKSHFVRCAIIKLIIQEKKNE